MLGIGYGKLPFLDTHKPNCWVWEPAGQMSEYPIPHGEHHEPCTLRRSYKSAFLFPKQEIQGLINLPWS
jgi:hypothetical protein